MPPSQVPSPFKAAARFSRALRHRRWTDFHRLAGGLPEAEREVFDLLWYQDLTQEEAAALLGVDVRTVQRRWRSARLNLAAALKGEGT